MKNKDDYFLVGHFWNNAIWCSIVAFLGYIFILNSGWNMKKRRYVLCSSFFIVYLLFFVVYPCGKQWGYLEKKLQNATITRFYLVLYEIHAYFGDTFIRWISTGAFFSLENCSHFSKSMYAERSQKIGVKACLKTIKRAHYKNFCNS